MSMAIDHAFHPLELLHMVVQEVEKDSLPSFYCSRL